MMCCGQHFYNGRYFVSDPLKKPVKPVCLKGK